MPTATITSKGQITLPREVRESLHLAEGDRVEFRIYSEGDVRLHPLTGSVKKLSGILHRPGMRPVTLAEMEEGIERFHAEENARILRGEAPRDEE